MDNKIKNKILYIVQAGLIASIYTILTVIFAPISYGQVQVRISEALTILPYFTSAAIPGLFIGCLISNIYGGLGLIDIIVGSLATLLASVLTYYVRKNKYLVPLPPVVVNALVVGWILNYTLKLPFVPSALWVGLGELIACYGLGLPLMIGLNKYKNSLFKNK